MLKECILMLYVLSQLLLPSLTIVKVSLMESVRTYSQTVDKVATCPEIATLVAEYQSNAQEMITKG